jgi:hypothetical protein
VGGGGFKAKKNRRANRKFSLGDFGKCVLRVNFLEYNEPSKEASTSSKLLSVEKLN